MKSTGTLADQGMVLPTRAIVAAGLRDAVAQFDPRVQLRAPSTLGVYVGAIVVSILAAGASIGTIDIDRAGLRALLLAIAIWLWLTLLLVNFIAAVIRLMAKTRAARLRSARPHVHAKRLLGRNRRDYHVVEADTLRRGDVVLVEAEETVPANGTVIDGTASVSEAAVTGESAPVLRSARPETASVRAGSLVLSDWLLLRVQRAVRHDPGSTHTDGCEEPCTRCGHVPAPLPASVRAGRHAGLFYGHQAHRHESRAHRLRLF